MTDGRITTRTSARYPLPVPADDLRAFLDFVPSDSLVTFTMHEGGDQRDPHPASITVVAEHAGGPR